MQSYVGLLKHGKVLIIELALNSNVNSLQILCTQQQQIFV